VSVFAQLVVDVLRVALGLTPFSWLLWAYVSVLLLLVGPLFAHVAPRVVDPPARMLATDPVRVVLWMPLSVLGAFVLTILLVITIFGAMLMPIIAILAGMVGYLALAQLIGGRIAAAAPAWLATALGIVVLRAVRLVPFVGAAAHSLLVWIGFAAASCLAVRMARAWHRRRMPDVVQFRGEMLVEWYPDGDPADGRPSIGTGRPVLENVRGDEDRLPRAQEPDSDDD
jgi:hypothetical protein